MEPPRLLSRSCTTRVNGSRLVRAGKWKTSQCRWLRTGRQKGVSYLHTSGYLLGTASGTGSSVQADLHLGLALVLFLFSFLVRCFSSSPHLSHPCDRELWARVLSVNWVEGEDGAGMRDAELGKCTSRPGPLLAAAGVGTQAPRVGCGSLGLR